MADSLHILAEHLEKALDPNASIDLSKGGYIRAGYDSAVDEYRSLTQHGKEYLAKLQNTEKEKTGINSLKIKSNKVFGYFFEVPRSQSKELPEYFIRKQTLANAERFITPELKEYEEKVFSAEEKLIAREQQIFSELQGECLQYLRKIQEAAEAVAELDMLFSFATTAQKYRYTKPNFSKNKRMQVRKGRHPVIEALAQKKGTERFIPNDLELDEVNTLALVTGPNMAGKSTYLRQNALILLLAHIGSFVPAEQAELPCVDHVFTRIGSGDVLTKGQSTFLVEMQEASHILRNATADSFVILDEIGRGTSTFDGLSLAWAITEFLEEKGIKTLFATHYHELIDLVEELSKAKNLAVAVLENEQGVTFLHQIMLGGASKSFGIEVAELAGMPERVTGRAKEILQQLEQEQIGDVASARRQEQNQQDLFALPKAEKKELSRMEKELQELNVENMTPMEALQKVWEWKRNK